MNARTTLLTSVLLAVAALSGGLSTSLAAQSAAVLPDTLTLEAAFRLAAEFSPALERVEARRGIAEGTNRVAGQWPNPTLEYRRENIGSPLQPDEFVTAYIPIDLTGRRIQLSRATSRGRARATAQGVDEQRDVQLSIARAWVQASLATSIRRIRQRQADAVAEIARLEDVRAREGATGEASASRTRVEAARLRQSVALDQAAEQSARVVLATLLGIPATAMPEVASLESPVGGALPAFGAPLLDPATGGALTGAAATTENQVLVQRARQARAALQAAGLASEEAALRQRVERGGVLGDWQLQGGTKRTSGFMTGQVGLAVPLPVFNRNGGARQASANRVRDAEAAYRELELQIAGEVIAAADNVRRLEALGDELLASPALGDLIVESARVAYAEGEMSLLELLDANRAWADAYLTAQQYHANLLLARLTLARAIGAPVAPESVTEISAGSTPESTP